MKKSDKLRRGRQKRGDRNERKRGEEKSGDRE
jgi:hypothetical protein